MPNGVTAAQILLSGEVEGLLHKTKLRPGSKNSAGYGTDLRGEPNTIGLLNGYIKHCPLSYL